MLTQQHDTLAALIALTGAQLTVTDAVAHDRAVALISHLPLLLSCALQELVEPSDRQQTPDQQLAQLLASSGYQGMVRLARGNPQLNADLLTYNHQQLSQLLPAFGRCCQALLNNDAASPQPDEYC